MNEPKPLYYPSRNPRRPHPTAALEALKLKHSKPKECPLCKHGMLNDAKTGKLRDCTACRATGFIPPPKKFADSVAL